MTHRVFDDEWRECPRWRYPMVRRMKFRQHPEQVWVDWNPDEWVLPVHVLIMGGLLLLAFTVPRVGEALFGGPHRRGATFSVLEGVGVGLAIVIGYSIYLYRRRRCGKLAQFMQRQDWGCARCLHAERE